MPRGCPGRFPGDRDHSLTGKPRLRAGRATRPARPRRLVGYRPGRSSRWPWTPGPLIALLPGNWVFPNSNLAGLPFSSPQKTFLPQRLPASLNRTRFPSTFPTKTPSRWFPGLTFFPHQTNAISRDDGIGPPVSPYVVENLQMPAVERSDSVRVARDPRQPRVTRRTGLCR
jgi:hypothetical protein